MTWRMKRDKGGGGWIMYPSIHPSYEVRWAFKQTAFYMVNYHRVCMYVCMEVLSREIRNNNRNDTG